MEELIHYVIIPTGQIWGISALVPPQDFSLNQMYGLMHSVHQLTVGITALSQGWEQ